MEKLRTCGDILRHEHPSRAAERRTVILTVSAKFIGG